MSLLLTPGPVPIPPFVAEALAKPVIHHRTTEFRTFYNDLLDDLRYLFQTEGGTGTMIGSGTFGVECALYSLFRPEDEVLVVEMGKFSERWGSYGVVRGLQTHRLSLDWGQSPTIEGIQIALREMRQPKGLVLTHSETATGAICDLEEIALAIKSEWPDILIVVDGITSIGALPFYMDAWQVDAAVTASQKALMNPAGLVAFGLSEAAQAALQPTHSGDFQNWYNYLKSSETGDYPFTAPVQLLFGVGVALQSIRLKGLPAVWQATHHAARVFRDGLKARGGVLFPTKPSDSLSAFSFPDR
ncbi:MAG: aminotransferase class V-fold PLP-dependent enzyme, partial [Bacteroidota bacterium]